MAPRRQELINSSDKGELRLPPGLQQVQFGFTALSFIAPENVQFRYMLEGLDKNWVDAGTLRMASYSHPPPGHYRFKVIACNNDGIWNKIGDVLPVIFEPYFWETLWFKFAMTLSSFAVLCGVVVLVVRRRHRLVVERLEHQRALELERNRIARDLHDDLGVGLTEIGLLGDLGGSKQRVAVDRARAAARDHRPGAITGRLAGRNRLGHQPGQRHVAIFGGLFLSVCAETSRSRRYSLSFESDRAAALGQPERGGEA